MLKHFLKSCAVILLSLLLLANSWAGVDFNGDADAIKIVNFPNIFNFNSSFAISMWINADVVGPDDDLISNWRYANIGGVSNHGMFFEFGTAGKLRFVYRNNGSNVFDFEQTTSLATVTNYHLVANYDTSLASANASVYLGGVQMSVTANATSTFAITGRALYLATIDNGNDGFGRYFNGRISEVYVYSKALTQAEINLLAQSKIRGIGLQISNCVMYLPLDENPIATGINNMQFDDYSNNGNSGTGDDADGDSAVIGESILSYPPKIGNWQ